MFVIMVGQDVLGKDGDNRAQRRPSSTPRVILPTSASSCSGFATAQDRLIGKVCDYIHANAPREHPILPSSARRSPGYDRQTGKMLLQRSGSRFVTPGENNVLRRKQQQADRRPAGEQRPPPMRPRSPFSGGSALDPDQHQGKVWQDRSQPAGLHPGRRQLRRHRLQGRRDDPPVLVPQRGREPRREGRGPRRDDPGPRPGPRWKRPSLALGHNASSCDAEGFARSTRKKTTRKIPVVVLEPAS